MVRGAWSVNIRKFLPGYRSLDALVRQGMVPAEVAGMLAEAMRSGRSVIVSGPTHAGKTTLLAALVFIPGQRVSLEKVAEVRDALGIQYGALGFDQKRDLIRALLEIRVEPGFGARRAYLTHTVVTRLNEDSEDIA
ncbi:hypothetical protein NFX31_06060 [Microbacterium azadirachtae]|uniref:hypothetical protein n=1 Tax=Microbacterium azadirachtae TaxID=582680 RepID=UPI0021D4EBE4|nr:hypothetical protein [Microbacterium azadirachtae]UXW87086.1 hypothetical protein NFX31_06060 [Microbacterium azadirachtae]